MSERLTAARQAVQNMIMYLITELTAEGYKNPQQEVVNTILEMFEDSEALKVKIKSPNAAINPTWIVDNILVLIELMQKTQKLNASDLVLIKQNLIALKGCVVKE